MSKFVVRSESIESILDVLVPLLSRTTMSHSTMAMAVHHQNGMMRSRALAASTAPAKDHTRDERHFLPYIACTFADSMSSNASASSATAQHNDKRQRTDEMKANAKTDSCTNEPKLTVTPDGPI